MSERIVKNGFSKERLKDAIENIIDKFQYKQPNISDIISFDKRIKLYTWHEAYRVIEKGEAEWSNFEIILVNNHSFESKRRIKKCSIIFPWWKNQEGKMRNRIQV